MKANNLLYFMLIGNFITSFNLIIAQENRFIGQCNAQEYKTNYGWLKI